MRQVLTLCAALAAAPALADPLDAVVRLSVLPGWQTGDGRHMAALALDLAPGWKTYWRAPGDAGIPPEITLERTENVAKAVFHWPVPEVFDQNGMRSIGYHDRLVLPLELTLHEDGAAVAVAGIMDIGICNEVCVPAQLSFAADLAPGGRRDPAIVAALVNRPLSAAEAGVAGATCRIAPTEDGLRVTAVLRVPPAGAGEALVIEAGDPGVWVSEPEISREGDILTAEAEMISQGGAGFALDRSAVRFTLLGSLHAVDIRGCTAP